MSGGRLGERTGLTCVGECEYENKDVLKIVKNSFTMMHMF